MEGLPPIEDRVKELRAEGLSEVDIVLRLYDEGYPTQDIMKMGFSLRHLARRRKMEEKDLMTTLEGPAGRGEGYLAELKTMIRSQISRTRELTELFYDVGLGVLLAALRKSGMKMEDYRKIALEKGAIREALKTAGETAFKALEYYDSDVIGKLEEERDEARVAYSLIAAQLKELTESLDPKVRLEKMIHTYLVSGNVDATVLTTLIDKWLSIEVVGLKAGVMVK
jgi:lambda repressor-like predicted transcriptional regulator